MSPTQPIRVRYQLASLEEGFVLARTASGASHALQRILRRQRSLGRRVRRRARGAGSGSEYLVTSPDEGMIARYWIEGAEATAGEPARRNAERTRRPQRRAADH